MSKLQLGPWLIDLNDIEHYDFLFDNGRIVGAAVYRHIDWEGQQEMIRLDRDQAFALEAAFQARHRLNSSKEGGE